MATTVGCKLCQHYRKHCYPSCNIGLRNCSSLKDIKDVMSRKGADIVCDKNKWKKRAIFELKFKNEVTWYEKTLLYEIYNDKLVITKKSDKSKVRSLSRKGFLTYEELSNKKYIITITDYGEKYIKGLKDLDNGN